MNLNATLFAQFIVFFLLAWITMKYIWPPITRILDGRIKKIADALTAAEKGQKNLIATQEQIKQDLQKAHERALSIINDAQARAKKILEEGQLLAEQESIKNLTKARKQIEQEVLSAKEALQKEVVDLVITGVEKILEKEVDAKQHTYLLNNLKLKI